MTRGLWRVPVALNLLPPLVAWAWAGWLAQSNNLVLDSWALRALALTVWLVYAVDGLLDSRGVADGRSLRRDFHRKWKLPLLGVVLAGCAGLVWLAGWKLAGTLVAGGLCLGIWVGLHLLHSQALRRARQTLAPKELTCGFLFAAAIGLLLVDASVGALPGISAVLEVAREGPWALARWWFGHSLALFAVVLAEPVLLLLGWLVVANCLLTGDFQDAGEGGESAGATHVAPWAARIATWLPAGVVVAALVAAHLEVDPGTAMALRGVALAGALLLLAGRVARLKAVDGDRAGLLFDLAILAPPLVLTWAGVRPG